ncbi:unnamed protein product [Rotaria sordida]|uniref:Uncharacterized protein n=1 Tax=Rotaria sordida TaxID=392033 RepID=A0A814QPP0_9BILA|nr:unnamed protein product [Rotaria sordida]CAF1599601.1 unnamed protein product [Rotaria sordida]
MHTTGELNLQLTDNIHKIRDGIDDKLGSVVELISTCTGALIIGWKLTLVVLSCSPIIIASFIVASKITTRLTMNEINAYGKSAAVAEEVISSVRTVLSYNGQEHEIQRYERYLDDAKKSGIKRHTVNGINVAICYLLIYWVYALGIPSDAFYPCIFVSLFSTQGFWYGAQLIWKENYTIGNVYTVFMTVVIGIFRIQRATSFVQALSRARAAAYIVWKIIDEPSNINNYLETGLEKDDLIGDIHFSNIHFSYPSRPDIPILKGLSFDVKRGQTVALVGLSGSGKSTCIQLLQRFYDPSSGSILIDGKQINEYNLKWLRQHIGVVSQEPVLFHTTIRQNILLGSDSATDEEMYQAAKMANAHAFIMTLPDKYETKIGERGATLSGGQKQRIAIARALIRDPKILLLDEATSALDNESEKIVQEALDRAAQSRTTLVIAHRLSTIRYADKIIVMQQGEIVEEGNHESLMQIKSVYYGLVQQQSLRQAEEEEEEEEEFEQKKAAEMFLFDQTSSDYFDIRRNHGSTIVSISPSIFSLLYRNRNYTVSEEDNESYLFACSGEILTKRLRSKAFRAILRQESAYFDQAQHSTGALCTRLATEASAVQGASGVHFGIIFQSLLSMISGIFLGFAFSWQLTLLIMAFLPFLLLGSISRIRLTARFERKDNKILENAGKV